MEQQKICSARRNQNVLKTQGNISNPNSTGHHCRPRITGGPNGWWYTLRSSPPDTSPPRPTPETACTPSPRLPLLTAHAGAASAGSSRGRSTPPPPSTVLAPRLLASSPHAPVRCPRPPPRLVRLPRPPLSPAASLEASRFRLPAAGLLAWSAVRGRRLVCPNGRIPDPDGDIAAAEP